MARFRVVNEQEYIAYSHRVALYVALGGVAVIAIAAVLIVLFK